MCLNLVSGQEIQNKEFKTKAPVGVPWVSPTCRTSQASFIPVVREAITSMNSGAWIAACWAADLASAASVNFSRAAVLPAEVLQHRFELFSGVGQGIQASLFFLLRLPQFGQEGFGALPEARRFFRAVQHL